MPFLSVTLLIDSDTGAEPQQIFEYRARIFVNQAQLLNIQKAGGDTVGVYSALPSIEQSPALNVLCLAVDNPLLVKLASVAPADGIISLKAGGLLLVIQGSLAAGIASNVLVNNVPANAVTITGAAGGT